MNNIFSPNSKFGRIMTKVADCMILSLLWALFSIPLFTLGASTTALYYSVVKVIREDEGSCLKEYWKAFKSNFFQSTVVLLAAFALCVLWGYACLSIFETASTQDAQTAVYAVYFVVLGIMLMWLHYIISYIARFKDKLLTIVKNTMLICLAHLPYSLLLLCMAIVVLLALFYFYPSSAIAVVILPAVYLLAASFILEWIYGKYMDTDDLPAESE